MNLAGLAAILLITCGALFSPFVLVWSVYCLSRSNRRMEGAFLLLLGALFAGVLVLVGAFTAPAHSPGLFRFQALIIIAGFFGFGAVLGEILYFLLFRWRRLRR